MSNTNNEMQQFLSFEDFGNENGIKFWWASDFCQMLGYASIASFMKPINKAIQACMSANIEYHNDFRHAARIVDEKPIDDIKLSRFACYLVAMNADAKNKAQVARAQIYFADQVEKINLLLEGSNDLDRLTIRDEIKTGNIALNSAAKQSGVVNYALFQDAGYRGLYNRSLKDVKRIKGIDKGDHYDFMGRTELAANLFRTTLTEERLKTMGVIGENAAIAVHKEVGRKVRNMVVENTGKTPEQLSPERKLGDVKKELKKASKALNQKK